MGTIKTNFTARLYIKSKSDKITRMKLEEKVQLCYEEAPFPDTLRKAKNFKKTLSHIVYWINLNLHFLSPSFQKGQPKTILCAGCGTGEEAIALAKIFPNCKIDALDISWKSLSIAKQNIRRAKLNNIALVKSSILEDLPFSRKKYDMVYSAGVIHHLENPKLGFKVLTNKLKKKGKMVVMLYNSYGLFIYKCRLFLLKILAGENFKKRLFWTKKLGFDKGKNKVFIYDSYINPQVKTFTIEVIKKWAEGENLQITGLVPPLDLHSIIEFATLGQKYFFRRKKLMSTILGLSVFFLGKKSSSGSKRGFKLPIWKTFIYQIVFLLLGKGECQYLLEYKYTKVG